MTHALKTWPEYFKEVQNGRKNFEVRKADRAFKMGDRLLLQEYNPNTKEYTGEEYESEIAYILWGGWKGAFDLDLFRKEVFEQIKRLNAYSSNYRMAKRYNLIEEKPKPVVFYFEEFSKEHKIDK